MEYVWGAAATFGSAPLPMTCQPISWSFSYLNSYRVWDETNELLSKKGGEKPYTNLYRQGRLDRSCYLRLPSLPPHCFPGDLPLANEEVWLMLVHQGSGCFLPPLLPHAAPLKGTNHGMSKVREQVTAAHVTVTTDCDWLSYPLHIAPFSCCPSTPAWFLQFKCL